MTIPLRILTSFNSRLYNASGQTLLRTIREHLGNVTILAYFESRGSSIPSASCLRRDYPEIRNYGVELVDLLATESFRTVFQRGRHLVPVESGGSATGMLGEAAHQYWNRRWLAWFSKIAAQFDALTNRPLNPPGLTLWMDCDMRLIAPFRSDDILNVLTAPVGIMRGTRVAPETGFIVFDERRTETVETVREIWELFASLRFTELPRWDDGYVYGVFADRLPHLFQDFAAGRNARTHTNTNGHETVEQILPLTLFGNWLEHDKGLHRRLGLYTPTGRRNPIERLKRLLQRFSAR
jgi:hypothetical protein